jgi:threonine dehydratase
MMYKPKYTDVLKAKKRISPYLNKTPLLEYSGLSKALGFRAYIKHENMQPTGAFKIRGGINLISQLGSEEKEKGVITASSGNHGQSIALASQMFGVKATICVPSDVNPDKAEAIESFGAEIIADGRDFDDARLNAERIAEEQGLRYVHSANEPLLIAGVGTVALEILEDLPEFDAIIVPLGAGSQAAGVSLVMKNAAPDVEVMAVQAENAPSAYLSWKSGKLESTESANTMADGLATRSAFELTQGIIRDNLDDFVLVSEEELKDAIRLYVEKAHVIAEGAGAAPLAAAYKLRDRLKGKKVVLVLSGGNLTAEMLKSIL